MTNGKVKNNKMLGKQIPIELPHIAGWKDVTIKEYNEPLLPLGAFSDNFELFTDSVYFGERDESPYPEGSLEGSLLTVFVREKVAESLIRAQRLLPKEMYLVVFDAYRTLNVQQALYDSYYNKLKLKYPNWSEEQLSTEAQKYVSIPSHNPTRPSPHNTGGSVDLAIIKLPKAIDAEVRNINKQLTKSRNTNEHEYLLTIRKDALIRKHAELLNFGTPFDHGGGEAALNYMERLVKEKQLSPVENEALANRRILYNVMIEAGFEPYEDEWWHYNSRKSQMGTKTANLEYAEYGAITLSQENLKHEEMRKNYRHKALSDVVGLKTISLPEVAMIKPPKR